MAKCNSSKPKPYLKKVILSGAYAAYINGVNASLDFVSNPPQTTSLTGNKQAISVTDIATYMSGPCVKQSAGTLTLADILQQKFISLYVWGSLEAWADERRYSYDTNIFQGFSKPGTLYPDNAGKQVYVVRPRYNSEYIWNVPALKSFGALDPDYHTKNHGLFYLNYFKKDIMKSTFYIITCLFLIMITGCKKNTITQLSQPATGAQLRFIQAIPGLPAVDEYVNGTKISPQQNVGLTDNLKPTSIITGISYPAAFNTAVQYGALYPGGTSVNYALVATGNATIKIAASTPLPALISPQTAAPNTTVVRLNPIACRKRYLFTLYHRLSG
jgi:hypothetical protein